MVRVLAVLVKQCFVLAPVVKKQRLGAALALVVARANANGVHPPPVVFSLGVNLGVAVHLAGGGLENARFKAFGQAQHVDGAVHTGLGGLHRVKLVMDRACGASQVVDLAHLHIQGEGHVVAHKLKVGVAYQVPYVLFASREVVVHTHHIVAIGNQLITQVAA